MVKKSAPKLSPSQRKKWLETLQPYAANQVFGQKSSSHYKFVIDTNVLISAVLYGGRPEELLKHVLRNGQLVLSDYIVEEFVDYIKLVRPKVSRKWLRLMRQKLESYCESDDFAVNIRPRDINDVPVIALALRQKAIIVTGDKDLLECSSEAQILSTDEYLSIF